MLAIYVALRPPSTPGGCWNVNVNVHVLVPAPSSTPCRVVPCRAVMMICWRYPGRAGVCADAVPVPQPAMLPAAVGGHHQLRTPAVRAHCIVSHAGCACAGLHAQVHIASGLWST